MKSFLSKNWKRILIIIAIVLIVLNLISKIRAPHILVYEFSKYGQNISNKGKLINPDGLLSHAVLPETNLPSEIVRLAIVLIVAIVGISILVDFSNKKEEPKKKK